MAERSGIPYAWSDAQPSRIGVLPCGTGGAAKVRWFGITPGYAMHLANAYEDALGRIVVEGPAVGRDGWQRSWNWWAGAPRPGGRAHLAVTCATLDGRPHSRKRQRSDHRRPHRGVPDRTCRKSSIRLASASGVLGTQAHG
ncbi:carotenoid oxygenase family protein [Streptomyces sp. NPDC003362]